jgi:predicted transcriptional regulator
MGRLLVDEQPTLRLVTLRRLVRGTRPPVVLAQDARVAEVREAFASEPGAVVVLVDAKNVLRGTLRLGDLDAVTNTDGSASAGDVMRTAPVVEAEQDIETARDAMDSAATDRVVVIGTAGELLGVLTDLDLVRKQAA